MPGRVEVTEANLELPEQAAAVRDLLYAYAQDVMGGGQSLPPAVLREVVPGLQRQPGALVFLAYLGSLPVGLAVAFVGFSTFAARPLVNVHDLAVLPGHRARGVGRALMDAVEAKARELGCCKITLEVRADNLPAQHLYKQLGFSDSAASSGGQAMYFWTKPLLPSSDQV